MTAGESPDPSGREVDESIDGNTHEGTLGNRPRVEPGADPGSASPGRIIPDAELRGALYAVAIALTSLLAALDLVDRELVPPIADAAGSLLVAAALVIAHLNRPKPGD